MKVSNKVKIGEDEFVVLELTLRQIINFFQELTTTAEKEAGEEDTKDAMNFFQREIQTLLNLALEGDYKAEDFMDYRPSELKKLYEAFKEANKVFFDTAAQMGILEILDSVKDLLQSEFSDLLVSSSKAAIKKSSSTDSLTS